LTPAENIWPWPVSTTALVSEPRNASNCAAIASQNPMSSALALAVNHLHDGDAAAMA